MVYDDDVKALGGLDGNCLGDQLVSEDDCFERDGKNEGLFQSPVIIRATIRLNEGLRHFLSVFHVAGSFPSRNVLSGRAVWRSDGFGICSLNLETAEETASSS